MYIWGKAKGAWSFDSAVPPPKGVLINYGLFQPIYTGELAERIKDELTSRLTDGERRHPGGNYHFSGIIMCYVCGCSVGIRSTERENYRLCCKTPVLQKRKTGQRYTVPVCNNIHSIGFKAVREWLHERLKQALKDDSPDSLFREGPEDILLGEQIKAVRTDMKRTQQQLDNWTEELSAELPERVRMNIRAKARQADQKLTDLESRLLDLQRHIDSDETLTLRYTAFSRLKAQPLEAFWQWPKEEINQTLRDYFGAHRMVLHEGQIVGIGRTKPRQRR